MLTAPPELAVEQVSIDRLRPDPANPRRISDEELESLTRSIGEFGFVQPIVARREDRIVIGGHQRLTAAVRLGITSVLVIWLDLPLEQARLLNLALNRISGEFDEQLLARLVADLEASIDVDLTLAGFGEDELTDLMCSLDAREKRERPETFDLDEALEAASRDRRTKASDLWQLGEHRLACGDATDAATLGRLLGDHGGQGRGRQRRRIANDALDPVAWEDFVRGWAQTLIGSTAGALYVCMSSKEWPLVAGVLAEEGGHWSDTIIWRGS